jgi:hypothetical protein
MNVADSLAELAALDRAGLVKRWASMFNHPAPRHAQVGLLRGALAWRIQMDAIAGAGRADQLVRGLRRSTACAAPAMTLTPGTRLLREWQGQTHDVTVLVSGFEYSGRMWRSLTAISREITGTAWSGPLFFGLRS